MAMPEALERLRAVQETLPPELRAEIVALGSEAVGPLIELLESDDDSWADIHAVDLLADLRATEAIRPMLDVLAATDFDAIIHDRIIQRLPELGPAVLEPAFETIARAQDPDVSESVASVLANLGVRDDRILELLYENFENDAVLGAMLFADYGDPTALEDLELAIFEYEPDFSTPLWRIDLDELVDAHTRLAGAPDPEIAARVEELKAAWRAHLGATARVGARKVGRNDPCPCGSGKKFKRCCLQRTAAS